MKKAHLFGLLAFLLIANTYGQEDCSELNIKLDAKDEIIAGQQQNISKLESDVKFYKESLDLINSKISVKQDDFVFKINSVTGKSDNGVIIVEGLVENTGALRALRSSTYKTYIYDTKGNNYKASEIKFGNLDHLQEFQKDL